MRIPYMGNIVFAAASLVLASANAAPPAAGGPSEAGRPATKIEGLDELDPAKAEQCDLLAPERCLYPFPNDHFTVRDRRTDTGLRVDLDPDSMPVAEPLFIPAAFLPFVNDIDNDGGGPIDPAEWNRNDGFSPGSMILAHAPGVDLDETGAVRITDIERSLDPEAPILVINANTGERHLIWAELDARAPDPESQALIIRPAANLIEGERYIVALRNLREAGGERLQAPPLFQAYRDRVGTGIPAFERRRGAMENIFARLRRHGVAREELYLAWDFTVASQRNLTERLLHIRDEAFARLGGGAPQFEITNVGVEIDGSEREGLSFAIDGTFEVPNFLNQPGGPPGSSFYYGGSDDPDALPRQLDNDTVTAPFRCQVAEATVAALDDEQAEVRPARPGLYGHGLFGVGPGGEFRKSDVRAMQNEHNFMFCATNWIGMATDDVVSTVAHNILADVSKFPQQADRLQQGILNAMFLAELLVHPDGFASHEAFHQGDGELIFERLDEVFFDGNSQGGIIGGALVATARNINRGVLGVPGANYSLLMRRFARWNSDFGFVMQLAYPDPLERTLILSAIQMLWDRGENNGYLSHLAGNHLPNTPARSEVLLQVAIGDHLVTMWSPEIIARTIGARMQMATKLEGEHPDDNAYFAIPVITNYPHQGHALTVWDSGDYNPETGTGTAFPPLVNIGPTDAFGDDPHESVRETVAAREQKSEFLRLEGGVIDTCGQAPCLTDDHSGLSRE